MKQKIVIMTALAALTLGTTLAFGELTADGGGVVGSKHDMNVLVGAKPDSKGRVCAFCHTPHHKLESGALLDYNPLWSHTINNTAVISQNTYKSVTFDSQDQMSITDPLTGPSRLCMSCHDGIIAVDQHYGIAGTVVKDSDSFGGIAIYKGSDLSNDHPIGFDLNAITGRDGGIRTDLLTTNPALKDKKIQDLGFKTGVGVVSVSIMTCASCHDVHNKDNVDSAFLYEVQAGSKFCLMCHDK